MLEWTRGCIVCATRSVGRAVKPPLTPIPVAGPLDSIGADVIQFPKTSRGNQYAVVFVDYLQEVFAVPDQSATIARLLVEEIVSRQAKCCLTVAMHFCLEVERLLGFKKTNTTADGRPCRTLQLNSDSHAGEDRRQEGTGVGCEASICISGLPAILNTRVSILPALWV